MRQEITTGRSLESFCQELGEFRVTPSFSYPNFNIANLAAEVTACRLIKKSIRRQIIYLKTSRGGYFLKHSTLVRSKDRRRHSMLPFRKWAEWRNLHRLSNAGIAAAKPVMKGEKTTPHPAKFFLLTEEVSGQPLRINSVADMFKFGEYTALLHSHGVFHADLHPDNIILTPQGRYCLIDVQEVFFWPWLPRLLRVYNLGKIYFNARSSDASSTWLGSFLDGYNHESGAQITAADLMKAVRHHQKRKYRSRFKRCCKNSTEFAVIQQSGMRGYKRRDFNWGAQDFQQAIRKGQSLKDAQVIHHNGVCLKNRTRRIFHRDHCRDSWKMSRALELRGISVPRALAYVVFNGKNYFLSELLDDSLHLNDYLSAITDARAKRQELRKLARWVKKIHDVQVWQSDFKSNNILYRQGRYYMIDLDSVRIRSLNNHNIVCNLAQLNASISNALTIRDRLRFYYYYSADGQPTRPQRRKIYRKVWNITMTKDTALYDFFPEKLALW